MLGTLKKKGKTTKNSGSKLLFVEEEAEVAMLNPRSRAMVSGIGSKRSTTTQAFSQMPGTMSGKQPGAAIDIGSDDDLDGEEFVEGRTSNSTECFVPIHFNFVYKNHEQKQFVCNVINIPTGLNTCSGLEGKIHPTVSADGCALKVQVDWPTSYYDATWIVQCMEDKISEAVPNDTAFKRTVYNMVDGFDFEMEKIRGHNKAAAHVALSGTGTRHFYQHYRKRLHWGNYTIRRSEKEGGRYDGISRHESTYVGEPQKSILHVS
jgi:hypothetical protein